MKAMAQPQAALRAIHSEQRRYLRLGSRSQRCTSHAGHSAGWSMPGTARERGYEPHPQEPHSLRFKDRLEKRPSMSEIGVCNRIRYDCQARRLYIGDPYPS